MKRQKKYLIAIFIMSVNISVGIANAVSAPSNTPSIDMAVPPKTDRPERDRLEAIGAAETDPYADMEFKHGDVSWLPALATKAGWPPETHDKLAKIVLRESGGCPNRLGGDAVDKNCNITHVTEWNHRSDTGLLQINGVNYNIERNKWAIACRKMNVCEQELLLDPLTNLQVGYLLYQEAGWDPWDPCAWGEEYAKRCKTSKKP